MHRPLGKLKSGKLFPVLANSNIKFKISISFAFDCFLKSYKKFGKSLKLLLEIVLLRKKIVNPSLPGPGQKEKVNLNFYFNTSLLCLKRFYKSLKAIHKTFRGTTKECENKNLSLYLF